MKLSNDLLGISIQYSRMPSFSVHYCHDESPGLVLCFVLLSSGYNENLLIMFQCYTSTFNTLAMVGQRIVCGSSSRTSYHGALSA